MLHFQQWEQFVSTSGQCATLPNWMSATGNRTAGFLPTGGFGKMLHLDQPTVLLGPLPARVNAEAICVVKVLRFICNFFDTSFY